MTEWINTSVSYIKQMQNGMSKRVRDQYLVEAYSFTEAESRITKAVADFLDTDFTVSAVSKSNISQLICNKGDCWYKVKFDVITVMEKSLTEKRTSYTYLAQASSLREAYDYFMDYMRGSMFDFEVTSITKTAICDVI